MSVLALNYKLSAITNKKQRKAFSIMELIVYMLVVLVLIGVFFFGLPYLLNQARITKAKQEMETLKTAVTAYQLQCIDQEDTITADMLKEGIEADNSIDGIAHKNFLPDNASIKDPWGGEYTITTGTDGSGSISTSNAQSVGGLDSEVTIEW